MPTPNLAIPHVAEGQEDGHATVNDALDILDRAMNDTITHDVSAGNHTITATEFTENFMHVAAPTVARTLTTPATKRFFAVYNTGSADLTVATGSTSFVVAAGDMVVFHTDGTTDGLVQVAAGGALLYGVAGAWDGTLSASSVILRHIAMARFIVPSGATGSYGYAEATGSDSQVDLDMQKNGASFGTMSFASGANDATFSVASDTVFDPGDRLRIVGPDPADATLGNVYTSIRGLRQ